MYVAQLPLYEKLMKHDISSNLITMTIFQGLGKSSLFQNNGKRWIFEAC